MDSRVQVAVMPCVDRSPQSMNVEFVEAVGFQQGPVTVRAMYWIAPEPAVEEQRTMCAVFAAVPVSLPVLVIVRVTPTTHVVFVGDQESRRGPVIAMATPCLLYTSPSPRDGLLSRMPSSA